MDELKRLKYLNKTFFTDIPGDEHGSEVQQFHRSLLISWWPRNKANGSSKCKVCHVQFSFIHIAFNKQSDNSGLMKVIVLNWSLD